MYKSVPDLENRRTKLNYIVKGLEDLQQKEDYEESMRVKDIGKI